MTMRSLLLVAFAALATGALAQTSFVYSGDTTNGAMFQRPSGLSSTTSSNSTPRYQATAFGVSVTGTYVGELNAAFDPYLLIYQDSFDPNAPLTNLIQGDRRYEGAFTVLSGTAPATPVRAARIFAGEPQDSNNETFVRGTGLQLTAGRKYISVVTSFYSDTDGAVTLFGFPSKGQYQVGLGGGPGNVTAFQAVPEPASMAALGLGALALLKRRKRA